MLDKKSQSSNQANDQIHCLSWVFVCEIWWHVTIVIDFWASIPIHTGKNEFVFIDEKSQSSNQVNDQIHCLSWVFVCEIWWHVTRVIDFWASIPIYTGKNEFFYIDEKSQSSNQANDQIHCLSWVFVCEIWWHVTWPIDP